MTDDQSGLPDKGLKDLAVTLSRRLEEITAKLQHRVRKSHGPSESVSVAACEAWITSALGRLNTSEMGEGLGQAPPTKLKSSRGVWEVLAAHSALRQILHEEASGLFGRPLHLGESLALTSAVNHAAAEAALARTDQINRQTRIQAETYSLHLQLLSHQLHGGLNGLLMMLEVLKGDLTDRADIRTAITDLNVLKRTILETSETLDALMEDISLEIGKRESVTLSMVTAETAEHFQSAPAARNWQITYSAEPGSTITSNRALLNVVLQQLIHYILRRGQSGTLQLNAKSSGDGGGRFEIVYDKPVRREPEFSQLMSPPNPHLVSPVSQLSIAHHAAQLLDARLHVNCEPRGISTVAIEIPPATSHRTA